MPFPRLNAPPAADHLQRLPATVPARRAAKPEVFDWISCFRASPSPSSASPPSPTPESAGFATGLSTALALLGLARIALDIAQGATLASAASDLAGATLVFGLGALAFRFRVLGGGDVKLLAAGALWLGAAEIGAFLLATALAGGLLALIFVAWQLARPGGSQTRLPGLPYAIAIAAGGILTTAVAALG